MITGRCYCGNVSVTSASEPFTVAYCHCADCKRWTGAPLPAFAAFEVGQVELIPRVDGKTFSKGVTRWCCDACGSPLLATFDYLADQVYVPLGLLEDAERLAPKVHCHAQAQHTWLHLSDNLPRSDGSGRDALNNSAKR